MRNTPPSGPDIGRALARVQSLSVAWLALFAPLALIYLAGVFYVVRHGRWASFVLGMPPARAESMLVDLCLAALPAVILIAAYLRYLSAHRQSVRRSFIAKHTRQSLIRLHTAPTLIYAVQDAHMQIVWNADGPVRGGQHYPLPNKALYTPLDPAQFVASGVP